MICKTKLAFVLGLAGLCAAAAQGREKGPFNVTLRYAPQESVGSSVATLDPAVLERPVRLTMADGRAGSDPKVIGESSDDDDRMSPVIATNDPVAWADEVLRKNAADWGVRTAEEGPLTLAVKLVRLRVVESNKAVGSTYNGEVQMAATLQDAGGKTLWRGAVPGDATRYGRKRSEENANEVLSDAIKEAYAALLGDTGLQGAWAGKAAPTAAAASAPAAAGPRVAPRELLAELVKLKGQGFGTDLLVDYVNQRTLTAPLSADDMVQWKKQGMPEEVLKAALARPSGG